LAVVSIKGVGKMSKIIRPSNLEVNCIFPIREHPFYHLRLTFRLEGEIDYQIKQVKVNGQRVRDFRTYHNFSLLKDYCVRSGGLSNIVIRWDWKNGEKLNIDISGESEDGENTLSLKCGVKAPSQGGYWNPAWEYYASIVCTETARIARQNEPVHTSLAVYGDRIQDPERELRIVSVDPESGICREVPSQVTEINHFSTDGLEKDPKDEFFSVRYQSTTTFQLAFYADIPAQSTRIYLAFYGNPKAVLPNYSGILKVEGEGLGLSIENSYYKTLLSPKSGAIDEIHMKMGVNQVFSHHLETNGALHWNPGLYAPPRQWIHVSDWDPPANYEMISGPVFASTRRSGAFQYYDEESNVSITYRFYERVPWIHMSSKIEIKKDIAVKALRNGEIVLNRELVDEFAWRLANGKAGTMVITDGPRHPQHAKVLPPDTPWTCFFTRKHGCGLGMITSKLADFCVDGGMPKIYNRYSYLQWGPWVYYARPLVYTFASNNPGKLVHVPAGNIYYEEMAFVPMRVDPQNLDFQNLEHLYIKLSKPLDVQIVEDTDPRAPEGWMPPVLVEEFEEMDD